jgi:HD-GYP domain-containing protein (c-di-GMP phosphodiesterase class II)/HD-like signal output (HDOD) protein
LQDFPLELIDDVRLTLDKVYKRLELETDSLDIQIIQQLAEQLQEAIAIDSDVALATIQHKQGNYNYCAQHAVDTAVLAAILLKRMEYGQSISVIVAALTMNISYITLFNQLVFSAPRYNAIQKELINEHPRNSCEMLSNAGVSDKLWLDCVLCHHEMMDGSGFPQAISEKKIPPMARLLAACDYYCSEVQAKKYAQGCPANSVLIELFATKSQQYDIKLAPLFYNILTIIPAGALVELENGNNGIVITRNEDQSNNTFIMQELDSDFQPIDKAYQGHSDKIKKVLPLPYGLNIPLDKIWNYPTSSTQKVMTGRAYGKPPLKMELVKARRIIQSSDLPVMPDILSKIQKEMDNKSPNVNKISYLIASDVAISALTLKTVSKLVTSTEAVNSILHAITILGLDKLNGLVKAASLTLMFTNLDQKLLNYWEDAQTTALAAARIAEEISDLEIDEAYMAGLFQNVGCLLLSIKFKDYFDKTFDNSIEHPFTFLADEQSEFGTDRGIVSYLLCQEWALPEKIKLAAYYRNIENYSQISDTKIRTITAVISLASYITNLINKFSIEPNSEQLSLVDKTLDELMLNYDDVEKMKMEIMIEMKNS